MRIATWNVNSINVRLPHVLSWLNATPVDVLALQETKALDHKFPQDEITKQGYRAVFTGQPSNNGVALLSRVEPADVTITAPGLDPDEKRVIAATYGDVRVVNLYVVNGQEVGCEKYEHKMSWLAHVRSFLAEEAKRYPKLIVVGDFNIAPEDADVHDPNEWRDKILCSPPEREALQGLLDIGLADTFRLHPKPEGEFSWWPYWRRGFERNKGLRIDLILASRAMAEACVQSEIDRLPRSWERPSDHAPAVATFLENNPGK